MRRELSALTEDAKMDILDAEILIPILEEVGDKLADLERRIAALENA